MNRKQDLKENMRNLNEPNTFLSLIQLCDYFALQLLTYCFPPLSFSRDGDCVSILGHSCLQLREIVLVALTPSPQSASDKKKYATRRLTIT
jgi:hypothetical protein